MAGNKNALTTQVKQLGALTTIPLVLLIGPTVGYFIGAWIDRKTHTYPWFTIIFVALGFIASGREVIRLLRQVLKDDEKSDPTK
jgi:ATP synthase protein I